MCEYTVSVCVYTYIYIYIFPTKLERVVQNLHLTLICGRNCQLPTHFIHLGIEYAQIKTLFGILSCR